MESRSAIGSLWPILRTIRPDPLRRQIRANRPIGAFRTSATLRSTWKPGEAAIAIRVQLGDMPAMLGDIVVQLLAEHDEIDVVGRSTAGTDALEAARRSRADLLVIRGKGGDPLDSITANPRLIILAIDADGHDGSIIRFGHESVILDRASVGRLARSIAGDLAGDA